ncbi:hypothetical protein RFI_25251, partial [Reticulomyxa filosa]
MQGPPRYFCAETSESDEHTYWIKRNLKKEREVDWVAIHIKTKVEEWTKEDEKKWTIESEEELEIQEIKCELKDIGNGLDIKNLK